MIYYWAYLNNKNNFSGGLQSGGRTGFAAVYRQAVKNLLLIHGSLDFMIVNAVLRPGYSLAVSKKYFNQAKKELIHAAEQGS